MTARHTVCLSAAGAFVYALSSSVALAIPAAPSDIDYLLSLTLEELGKVEVTTASRRAERLADAPASVFVIHGADIRALGITSLGEALRLAPNLHVAQINSASHALSARGMKTSLSNKLLVMIDGRPIYTPLFAGVLWDMQDVLIEDIDRIEVVSGPGAAAWGANAVNGVINIITLPSGEIRGGMVRAWTGEAGDGVAARQAFAAGRHGNARLYAKSSHRSRSNTADGQAIADGWTQQQAGFRGDWQFADSALRLQADAFRGESSMRPAGPIEADGFNLLGHWSTVDADGGHWSAQAYLDVVDRDDPQVLRDRITISAFELNHDEVRGAHRLSWGAGYRYGHDRSMAGRSLRLIPDERALKWAHAYLQDQITLGERLTLDVGLRLDSNVYTGVEWLPTARIGWSDRRGGLLWSALSRAVRSPARFDRDLRFPASEPFIIRGGPEFDSEIADVFELGYRAQPTEHFAFSLTAFHHRYDELRGGSPAPQGDVFIDNRVEGELWGVEGWLTLRVAGEWEFAAGLMELRKDFRVKPGPPDPNAVRDQGNDPEHQYLLRATRRLGDRQQLSAFARHVSALPAPAIDSYTAIDLRWSLQLHETVELGVLVRNLLDREHTEFAPTNGLQASEFDRSARLDMRLSW